MSSQIIPVDPFDCIIFGGTGDLAERKLLPALYHRQKDGQMTEPTRIIGASRSDLSTNEYRAFAHEALKTHVKDDLDSDEAEKFLGKLDYPEKDAPAGAGLRRPQVSRDGSGQGIGPPGDAVLWAPPMDAQVTALVTLRGQIGQRPP